MAVALLEAWGTPLLIVAVSIGVSVAGSELLRWRGARRLSTLRGQHWTEQTRVLAEVNSAVRAFRLCLTTASVAFAALANPELRATELLRFVAVASAVIVLLGDPGAGRWAGRATAGALSAVSWGDAQRLALVMFPSRIVLLGFAGSVPLHYDVAGGSWGAAFLLTLILCQAGGAAFVLRALGSLRPARQSLQQLVSRAAHTAGVNHISVYELKYPRANALALPLLQWVTFTSAALEGLDPAQLEAIAAHELGHLREARSVKWVRVASGCLLFLPLGLIPAFPATPVYGFIGGCVAVIVGGLMLRVMSQRLEQRADALAHHDVGDAGLYARALERIYQLNWAPAVVRGQQHPSLYDRMQKSGVTPDYPRPRPPGRGLLYAAIVLGFGTAFVVSVVVSNVVGA